MSQVVWHEMLRRYGYPDGQRIVVTSSPASRLPKYISSWLLTLKIKALRYFETSEKNNLNGTTYSPVSNSAVRSSNHPKSKLLIYAL
jgi:hypothetical protein